MSAPSEEPNVALADEIEALNSIYGDQTIKVVEANSTSLAEEVVLRFPDKSFSFNLVFEATYPDTPPVIKGIHSVSDGGAKGEGRTAARLLTKTLQKIWSPGQVCLFDLIEEAQANAQDQGAETDGEHTEGGSIDDLAHEEEETENIASQDKTSASTMYAALIRTHHITSRKKVATLKAVAKEVGCAVLLRSGATPGVMYVESRNKDNVKKWVDTVHGLRYKDYQLVSPTSILPGRAIAVAGDSFDFEEVGTVKDFGAKMQEKGILDWWRKAMGYLSE